MRLLLFEKKKNTRKMAVWVLIRLYHTVDQFWNNVFDFISTKSGIDLISTNKHKQFGFQKKENDFYFINGLILCARFFIYRCKYSETIPNMLQYFNMPNCIRTSEHCIAKRNNKLTSHMRKWSLL